MTELSEFFQSPKGFSMIVFWISYRLRSIEVCIPIEGRLEDIDIKSYSDDKEGHVFGGPLWGYISWIVTNFPVLQCGQACG